MAFQFQVAFATKEEYSEHLKTRKPTKLPLKNYLRTDTIQDFDLYSSVCRLFYDDGNGFFRTLNRNDITTMSPIIDFFEKSKEFYITPNGVAFYKVLDIRIGQKNLLEFSILLMTNNAYIQTNHSFMIMPFRDKKLNDFYKENIKKFLQENLSIQLYRSDDFNDNDVIIETIYREIEKSEFLICEISECNKNVFFEIGYAKAMKKELIFLLQRGVEHNFVDVAHIRRIDYDLDNPTELQEKLKDTIKNIQGKR